MTPEGLTARIVAEKISDAETKGAAGNSVVKGFVTVTRAWLSYLHPIVLSQPERLKENAIEIKAIIDAIIARKPQAAWQAAVNHVNMGAKATLKVLEQLEAVLGERNETEFTRQVGLDDAARMNLALQQFASHG
ncbi:FCD domain-containing protein [Bradyrhizobium sp. BWA-3-5]|nr:FCD domain-containing protein [Bradyrhizobium sp. BWA-3-5]WOH63773.1 FCD domain-containing protein [Bradyrhizobium sp. BWA-3-5]